MGARPVSRSRRLHIIEPMRALASSSDIILVSLLLYFFKNSNTLLSIYFFCNSRMHIITLYSGHVCIVLYVNALMLTPRMDLD
jgi:hypothetical protein